MKVFNRGVDINVSNEDALKVNGTKIIDKDGKIYGDIHAAAGSIGTTELADDAVTADKLADNAVVTANIVAKNVTGAKIADKGVDTAQIADGAIKALQISANAVETDKIKNANVTLGKLAAGITPSHIVKFFVLGSDITGTTLEGLAVGDLVLTVLTNGTSVVAPVTVADTLPADPADTTYIIVFRAAA
jgi:hypothetical protein